MNTLHGTELFTGNTMKLPAAIYEGKTNMAGLIKNWFWSYSGARMHTEQQHACCVREPQPAFTCSYVERCCLLGVISHQALLAVHVYGVGCMQAGSHQAPPQCSSTPPPFLLFNSSTTLLLLHTNDKCTDSPAALPHWLTGNFVGSLLFVAAVVASGVLATGAVYPIKTALAKASLPWGQVCLEGLML